MHFITMKKAFTLFAAMFFALGIASAQDVYFSGDGNGNGTIWKNNTLIYNMPDAVGVIMTDMKVADDRTLFSAGRTLSDMQSHIWMNDSVVFTAPDGYEISSLALDANGWTAAGGDKVWRNGETLFDYNSDSQCDVYALCIDTITGDVYAGGSVVTHSEHASIWKNDIVLWQLLNSSSEVNGLCFDGDNLYAVGYNYSATLQYGIIWENDSVIFQLENASFTAIEAYDGNLYWIGQQDGTSYVWQNGEVLYTHPGCDITKALCVNEFGVYYATTSDGTATLWKDGEILYQPEACESISSICVLPATPEPPIQMGDLTVMVNDTLMGSVIGGGSYPLGDSVTIEAVPNTGYEFLCWHDSITDNPRDILFTQDTTFTAYFGLAEYTITTTVYPEGTGTVTEGGIYHYGDTITLEAVADSSYLFLRWGDGNTDNPRDVIVTEDATFIAYFVNAECTIETLVTPEGTGTVTGAGTYPYGDTITLVATPILGYAFISWSDGNVENPRTLIVNENLTLTAQFDIQQCVVNTVVTPFGGGTITGGGTYPYGETVTLTAQCNTGYIFKTWDDDVLDSIRQVVVDRDTTFTAIFSPIQYTITTASQPEEGGTVEGGGIHYYGEFVTLTARPANDYSFLCWNDGIISNPRNITVTGDASYKAIFQFTGTVEYVVKLIPNDASMGTVMGEGVYPAGSVIEIKAIPFEHAQFAGWDDGNTDNPRTLAVNSNITLYANFEPRPMYTITVTSISNAMGTAFGGGTYYANSEISIGAIPNEGYHFTGWQDGMMSNPRTIVVTEDAEYIAYFSQTMPTTYTITVHYIPEQGTIIGAGTYTAGSTAQLVAIPATNYVFVKWSDEVTDAIRYIYMDHDVDLTALFSFTDVEENNAESLSLYPNPASDVIRIEGIEGIHDIRIFNLMGQVVKTATIQDNEEIHIGELPAGLYLIRIDSQHAIRFIKENK